MRSNESVSHGPCPYDVLGGDPYDLLEENKPPFIYKDVEAQEGKRTISADELLQMVSKTYRRQTPYDVSFLTFPRRGRHEAV